MTSATLAEPVPAAAGFSPARPAPLSAPLRPLLMRDAVCQAVLGGLLLLAVVMPLLNLAIPAGSPFHLSDQAISVLGKWLCLALLALALDLVWGYCGILSLGHGAFFALGGYMMGMHLMRLIGPRGEYGHPVLPDFMVFLNWTELPWFWIGFDSVAFAGLMVVLVPGLLAFVFGWFAFRSRVSGVYLSIITQALTYALHLAFYRNEMGFGGNNGFTDFKELLGLPLSNSATPDTTEQAVRLTRSLLFAATTLALAAGYLACRWIVTSKYGQVLIAVRDEEARVRFLGYPVERIKLFAWTVSAMLAGIAGALYVPQAGIINPEEFAPLNSIEAVVWVAVGGRGTLLGPIAGALGVKALESWFTSLALGPVAAWLGLSAVAAGLAALAATSVGPWRRLDRHRWMAGWAALGAAAILLLWVSGARTMPATINMAEYWLFVLGGLFALVTLVLPDGLAGLARRLQASLQSLRRGRAEPAAQVAAAAPQAPAMRSLLYLDGISVSFDGFKALNGLSLVMAPQELRAVIGPNGAGKTTMMDVITGKTRPDAGRAWFKDTIDLLAHDEAEIARAGIGRKFQRPTVFPNQTVWQNMAMAMRGSRHVWDLLLFRPRGDLDDRIRATLDTIALTAEAERLAGELAHGQKQWLEIGMLLIQEPDLLLIDEPAAGMTTAERARTAELLKSIARDRGVMVVEHDMEFVEMLQCRVTVLHEGRVLADGSLAHVKSDEKVIHVYLGR